MAYTDISQNDPDWTNAAEFEEAIDISAPLATVYSLVKDASKVQQIIPNISDSHVVANENYEGTYTVKVAGFLPANFNLAFFVSADKPMEVAILHFAGKISGMIRWDVSSQGNITHVTMHAKYKLFRAAVNALFASNLPFGGDLVRAGTGEMDTFIGKFLTQSISDMKKSLQNLKNISESA